jgi:hypothetical protein
MLQWLVIIARDRPDLWATWTSLYGGAERFEIVLDRRHGQMRPAQGNRPDRRVRSASDSELQARGYVVISQFVSAGASR